MRLKIGENVFDVHLRAQEIHVGDLRATVALEKTGAVSWLVNGKTAYAARNGKTVWVHLDGTTHRIEEAKDARPEREAAAADPELVAPMTGRIARVRFRAGDEVPAGEPIVVVEAMKMEHALAAPTPSRIREIRCRENDRVEVGQVLVLLEETPPGT